MSAVYLDHAATTPMHPAAIEAMTAVLATVGNASSLHTVGSGGATAHGGGARNAGPAAGRPAVRGDLHRGRHRERQPGGQGHLLGAAGRRPATPPHRHHPRRTPRGPRRGRMARRARGRRGDVAAGRPRRLGHRGGIARGARRTRRRGPGLDHVGQQRGRHHHADRRTGGRRRGVRRADAQRRDPGGRPAARRLRREWAVGDERGRAQVRRPNRGRRADAAPRHRMRAAAARRRAGTRRPFRHTGCRRRGGDGRGCPYRGGWAGRLPGPDLGAAGPADRRRARRDRRRLPQRRRGRAAPARQHALHLPRVRGRCAADVVGRQGNRVFDRFGVHRGCRAAVARARSRWAPTRPVPGDRCGCRWGTPAPRRTSTRRLRCCPSRWNGPGRPRWPARDTGSSH